MANSHSSYAHTMYKGIKKDENIVLGNTKKDFSFIIIFID